MIIYAYMRAISMVKDYFKGFVGNMVVRDDE